MTTVTSQKTIVNYGPKSFNHGNIEVYFISKNQVSLEQKQNKKCELVSETEITDHLGFESRSR